MSEPIQSNNSNCSICLGSIGEKNVFISPLRKKNAQEKMNTSQIQKKIDSDQNEE